MTKRKNNLEKKRRSLLVSYDQKHYHTQMHLSNISSPVLFLFFVCRVTRSVSGPSGYVVPNSQTHTGVSLKTLSVHLGEDYYLLWVVFDFLFCDFI